jgi:hypothetical protein
MKKVNLILSTLFSLLVSINFAQWTSVGAPDFTNTDAAEITLVLKQNGNPVVAYQSNVTGSTYVMECVTNNWIQLASAVTPTAAYQPKITLDQNDIPHVIYRNINDSIIIKKWNGTSWENFGSASGYVNKGNNAILKFNSLNQPFVAFSNYSVFGGKCSVMTLTGGVWTYYISTFVTNFQAIQLDFNIASDNTAYIIAQNSNGNGVSVYKSDATAWSLVGPSVNIANGIANFPKITTDQLNIPYILYGDNAVNIAATVRKWNGLDWELVGNQGFSVTSIGFSDLTIVNSIPTVIFQNGSSQVMRFENGLWSTYGNILGLGNSHALAIRNDNTVFAAYNNAYNGSKLNVKKFCTSETAQASNAICQGQTYSFGSQSLNAAGSYSEVFSNSDGCDSLVNLALTILPTYSFNQSISLCDGESFQIGNSTYTQSGNYQTILTSQAGCDSTIFTQLTILSPQVTSDQQTICQGQSYNFGSQTINTTGSYSEVFINSDGCDSLVNLSLTISPLYSLNQSITLCDGESVQIGNSTYTQSGNYQTILTSQAGCDSTIYTQLTILSPQVTSDQQTICQGQSYNFGSQTINTTGSYSEVFINSNGCDSLVNLSLTISPTYSLNQAISLCAGESLQIGNSTYSQSGNYQTILTSQAGCDSTINTQLTVLSPLVTSEQQTICEGNNFIYNGDTLIIEADYEYVFQAQNGCDSTHTIQLTIENALNPIITETDGVLSTSALGDNFQWIHCNNNSAINGAVTNEYTPINDGNYAVEVTNNQCTWMSDCFTFSTVSTSQINGNEAYSVYPNPANDFLTLYVPKGKSVASISIMDELGRIVAVREVTSAANTFDLLKLEGGMYFLTVHETSTESTILQFQVIK